MIFDKIISLLFIFSKISQKFVFLSFELLNIEKITNICEMDSFISSIIFLSFFELLIFE